MTSQNQPQAVSILNSKLSTFAIYTLGCKVNTYESEAIKNEFVSLGLLEVDFNSKADIYVVNTCSVTNSADSKSRNIIARAKRYNPDAILIVAGCYSQVASYELQHKLGIDILIGNKYKNNIVSLINDFQISKKQIVKVDNLMIEKKFENLADSSFKERTRAFLKIQDGCNFMCSYCIIPFARGKQRSKDMNLILDEIQKFVASGFQEIVLSGVNTAGYCDDNNNTFYDLLNAINNLKGNFRIRISSLEPFQITDEMITLITTNKKRFCSHWHICLQSGSDAILEKMNRKYLTSAFLELVNKIRTNDPLVSISTDYIAGFPLETLKDHEISKSFVEKVGFSFLHVFTYSPRKNTLAATYKEIHGTTKNERTHEMIALSNKLYKQYLKQFINLNIDVIFEKYENNIYSGKSSQYFDVLLKTAEKTYEIGKIYTFKVKSVVNTTAIIG